MISKDYLMSFSRFLHEASEKEITARIAILEETISQMKLSRNEPHRALVADMQFLLRRLREEVSARREISALERARA